MTVVVHKYGGSSVSTPERLQSVADRIVERRRDGQLPVVVVSAMGRTTDALLALTREVTDAPHRRELDMILTAGERISMALLAMAIGDRGYEAVSFTGSQAGIITTTDHNQARIIEVRPVRVREAIEQGRIVIVGGFAGVSTDKEVTTLGRGGSDTTAIALAAALEAESCEIFSDVDGVYTADPRVVEDAHRIDRIAAGELLEMGLRGARVLAPEAIDYARRHGVTLHARSSFEAGPGTVITHAPHPGTGRAVAVTADAAAVPVRLAGSAEAVSSILVALSESGLLATHLVRHNEGTQSRCELVLDTRNTAAWEAALERAAQLAAQAGAEFRDHRDLGTVTVVGEGIAEQRRCWEIAEQQLAELGILAHRISGSSWGITAEVSRSRLDDVVRSWHAAFPGLGDNGDSD